MKRAFWRRCSEQGEMWTSACSTARGGHSAVHLRASWAVSGTKRCAAGEWHLAIVQRACHQGHFGAWTRLLVQRLATI